MKEVNFSGEGRELEEEELEEEELNIDGVVEEKRFIIFFLFAIEESLVKATA